MGSRDVQMIFAKKKVAKKVVKKVAKKAAPKKLAKKAAPKKLGPNFQYLNPIPPKNPREEPESIIGLFTQGIEAFADFGLPPPVIAAVVAWVLFAAKILLGANGAYE